MVSNDTRRNPKDFSNCVLEYIFPESHDFHTYAPKGTSQTRSKKRGKGKEIENQPDNPSQTAKKRTKLQAINNTKCYHYVITRIVTHSMAKALFAA